MKVLVVYYSLDGNTKYLAESIAECVGADFLQLKPVKDIKNNKMKYFFGGKQATMRAKPELQPFDLNSGEYDIIIIGTPVWASTMTPAVRTFLNKVELKDKKIGLFSCHRGGPGKAIRHMKKLLEGNEILGTMNFQEPIKGVQDKKEQICSWAQNLIEKAQLSFSE